MSFDKESVNIPSPIRTLDFEKNKLQLNIDKEETNGEVGK